MPAILSNLLFAIGSLPFAIRDLLSSLYPNTSVLVSILGALLALGDSALALSTGPSTQATIYINKYFEVREHDAPVKYVFNGATRVARIIGSLSPNPRLQRLRVFPGWNLCSVAVTATNALAQFSAANGQPVAQAIYKWDPLSSNYEAVALGDALAAGSVFWMGAATAALLPAIGGYADPTSQTVPDGGAYVPGAGLEPLNLASPGLSNATAFAYDAAGQQWCSRLPAAIEPQSDLPQWLAPGAALFISDGGTQVDVNPALRIQYYHQDHLASSDAISDVTGNLCEENAFFPFGVIRCEYRGSSSPEAYKFAGKETDSESRLCCLEARFLALNLGRFLTTDPLGCDLQNLAPGELSEFLTNPQRAGAYAYALNQPLRYSDPTGRKPLSLLSRFEKDYPRAGAFIRSHPALLREVKLAEKAGAKYGGRTKPGETSYTGGGDTVYVEKSKYKREIVGSFLFELQNAKNRSLFDEIQQRFDARMITAEKAAYETYAVEVMGEMRLSELYQKIKKGLTGKQREQYREEFYVYGLEQVLAGKESIEHFIYSNWDTRDVDQPPRSHHEYYLQQFQKPSLPEPACAP